MSEPAIPRVALVGFGPWGRNLARNLDALGALAVVCDPDPAARALAARDYPGATVCATPAEVPTDCAVAIAAPAALHAQLALYFLERGQHTFVEKPLALRVEDCPALIECAAAGGLVLMVGHLLHHHPAVDALDALIREGVLGRLLYLYSNRLNLGRFRREENSLWSFAPHDIAVALRLVGGPPERVTCTGGSFLHPRIADTTLTTLSWAQGVQAHIHVSWLHPFKEQRLVVVGERAMAVFDDTAVRDKLVLYRHGVEWKDGIPVPRKAEPEPVPIAADEPLRREMAAFLDAVRHPTRPVRADGAEGMRVLAVLAAAERSLQARGLPMELAAPATLQPQPAAASPDAAPPDAPKDWAALGVDIHPSAIVGPHARIGAGTKVWHFVHVMDGARIGTNCALGHNVFVQGGAQLGDNVRVQNNVSIYDGVELGDGVFCGPSCVFTNVVRPRAGVNRRGEFGPTRVGPGATIGANATIVCGNAIGAHAFVGAGAVVTRPVPAHALVVGNPARVTGWVCRCGEKVALPARPEPAHIATCARCATAWRHDGTALREVVP